MEKKNVNQELAQEFLDKLKEFGADCVGFASIDSLRKGPSERLFPNMKDHVRDHFADEITTGLAHGEVLWEEGTKTAIVFGVYHPQDQPEMDWWCGEIDPPGNKKLLAVSRAFKKYLAEAHPEIKLYAKRYHVERGGIYLKEAAVAAGLGCIGKNNLLVNPEVGPRLRLRAMLIDVELEQTGPLAWDPCSDCDEPCRRACPQKSFEEQIYTQEETGLENLPGRDGFYYRKACNMQMVKNETEAVEGMMPEVCDHPEKIIKYCRNCELSCRVGK